MLSVLSQKKMKTESGARFLEFSIVKLGFTRVYIFILSLPLN